MSIQFVWFDHRSDDPSGAGKFYEEVFDWKRFPESPPGLEAFGKDRPWSGMTAAEGIPAGWIPYIEVDDIDASAARARTCGAKLLKQKTAGPAGDFAVIQDPAGGVVAIWHPA